LVATLAVIAMFVGNIAALAQDNLKRLFAYSSISHAGYLMLGISAVGPGAGSAPLFYSLGYYLVVYGLAFLGTFAVLSVIEKQTRSTDIFQLSGLGFSHPMLGLCLAVFSLSAAGIPPTAGFFAKYFVFLDAARTGNTWFVVLGLVSSLIGVYYYLRVLVYLYMKESRERLSLGKVGVLTYAGIALCAFAMLFFAVSPTSLQVPGATFGPPAAATTTAPSAR
jgi:NADH-quinone oxidoreductase subunit N